MKPHVCKAGNPGICLEYFLIPKLDLCRAWEQPITGNTELAERKKKKRELSF